MPAGFAAGLNRVGGSTGRFRRTGRARRTGGRHRKRRLGLLAVALALALAAPATSASGAPPLRERLARALAVPHVARGLTTALAVDLATGAAVYSQNPGKPLAPASTEKLTVTYAALATLGPAHRLETEVLGEGRLEGSIWRGSLVLKGYGDPTLSTLDLSTLARQIRAAGITRVTGQVRGDDSFFDARRMGPGWQPFYYISESPPLSALIVDRGWFRRYIARNPPLAAALAFREALVRAGVRVAGRALTGRATTSAFPLARVESAPLEDILRFMGRESDNFVAEMLLKRLGASAGEAGTSARGARAVRSALAAAGIPLGGVQIADGSGLSQLNRLTARALVGILRSAWTNPEIRPAFYSALAVAGRSGTLSRRLRRAPAAGQVAAKTGTTRVASSLAGFVKRRFAFALIQNGYPVSSFWARRAQDRFVTVLAAQ